MKICYLFTSTSIFYFGQEKDKWKSEKCRLRIVDPPVLFIWNSEITLMLRPKTREWKSSAGSDDKICPSWKQLAMGLKMHHWHWDGGCYSRCCRGTVSSSLTTFLISTKSSALKYLKSFFRCHPSDFSELEIPPRGRALFGQQDLPSF